QIALRIEGGPGLIVGQHDVTFATVENDADARAAERVGPESADLENDGLVAKLTQCDLGVGHVAGIGIAEAPAVANHAVGQPIDAEAPAGDIHLVWSLVAHVAVAPFPLPV